VIIKTNKEMCHVFTKQMNDRIDALMTGRVVTIKEVFPSPMAVGDYTIEEIDNSTWTEQCFEKYEPIESRYHILDL